MSEGERVPLVVGYQLAIQVAKLLTPLCERVEIAGSIRRMQETVGDIEIVCIANPSEALFGCVTRPVEYIREELCKHYRFLKGKDKAMDYDLGLLKLNLYITQPEMWGAIYTIRTGPGTFSHRLVTPKHVGGYLPSNMQVKEGRLLLRSSGEAIDTPEEIDFFNAIGLKYIEPKDRK